MLYYRAADMKSFTWEQPRTQLADSSLHTLVSSVLANEARLFCLECNITEENSRSRA